VSTDQPPTLIAPDRLLTLEKFHRLAEVPQGGRLVRRPEQPEHDKPMRAYSAALDFEIGAHALRVTAVTNALDH
jgi:hypothetical protein